MDFGRNLIWLSTLTNRLVEKMNYEDQLEIVLENINSNFYLDVIRKIRLENKNEEIDSKIFLEAKEA
jgi:hypothetical protein